MNKIFIEFTFNACKVVKIIIYLSFDNTICGITICLLFIYIYYNMLQLEKIIYFLLCKVFFLQIVVIVGDEK